MTPQRLRFALEQIRPNQWERFEEFASAFLAAEYPDLRTVAGSGDRGRDGELFEPATDAATKLQYSLRQDWETKLLATAEQLAENFPNATLLIYATNQKIGPAADKLKAEIRRDQNLFVDIRDRNWFVERYTLDAARQAAAEALVEDIAMPILADKGLVERKAPALTSEESRAACVHLALQWADDIRDKGLTKLCFEALVRSVLRDTNPNNRMPRHAIHDHVANIVSTTGRERAVILTDAALGRLEGRALRHWSKDDEWCLSHEERERIVSALEHVELAESELLEAIDWEVARTHEAFDLLPPTDIRRLSACVRTAVETTLLRRGEAFAAAVLAAEPIQATAPDIESAVQDAMTKCGVEPADRDGKTAELLFATTQIVLREPVEPVQEFFRAFADAYTLFAFLRETPDVQSAVAKMLSVGEIWLDTTVILPLFAETLIEDRSQWRFTKMFQAATECGLTLLITDGVLEELETHTWNSIQYTRQPTTWRGRVPFLAATYVLAGENLSGFGSWVDQFRGSRRPAEDLAEYLEEEHAIRVGSLEDDATKASTELRGAVQEIWQEAHARRRFGEGSRETTGRLVSHDLENYLGVVERRRGERRGSFGYRTWWLTLDATAYEAAAKLRSEFGKDAPDSPVMSPDFMVSYLTIGPLRAQLNKADELKLPLSVADLGPGEDLPRDLIEHADALRVELHGKDERIVRRYLRDQLDLYRRRVGPRARGGMALVTRELQEALDEREATEPLTPPG